jgi:hypothetical protein
MILMLRSTWIFFQIFIPADPFNSTEELFKIIFQSEKHLDACWLIFETK